MKPRQRLQKQDVAILEEKLTQAGLTVQKYDDRIYGFDGARYVCGFVWTPAIKPPSNRSAYPGHWQFSVGFECHCQADIPLALAEAKRVLGWRKHLRKAWSAFHKSRSDKRWREYRSYLAAIYTRQMADD